jgi:glycosyltransferase involved in cell wall biosynthesis
MVAGPKIPLVTIVVPFFNDERFIGDCVRSIQAQDGVDWEIVAVDDCGTDRTADLVRDVMEEDPRIRLVRHDGNRGLAASRNTGLAYARGEMVAFLDADDFYFPDALATRGRRLARQSKSLSSIAGCYCGWEMVAEEAQLSYQPTNTPKNKRLTYMGCAGENPLIATAPVMWRSAVLDVGGFDESFPTAEDFEFWMRLLRQGYELIPTGKIGVAYRQKRSGMISDGLSMHARNANRVYDYVHRPLGPGEVSAAAPAPFRHPLAEHERIASWIRRIAIFTVLAEGAGDTSEVNELLSLLPSNVELNDLESSGVRGSIGSGIDRYELRNGELLPREREELAARALDLLIMEIASRPPVDRSSEATLTFPLDAILGRATEKTAGVERPLS